MDIDLVMYVNHQCNILIMGDAAIIKNITSC